MTINIKKKVSFLIIFIYILTFSTLSYASESSVIISLAGDTLLADHVGYYIEKHGVDYPWESVKEVFHKSHLTLVNLECAVGTTGEPQDKQYTYRAKPETLEGLVRAGVKGVSLANNHSLDYGRECFIETLDNLEKYNIKYTGGGRNLNEALKPVVWDINGIKVGFIGFSRVTPHVDWYAAENRAGIVNGYDSNSKNVIEAVKQAKEKADFLIVSLHWGTERTDYPRDNDVAIAKELIDNGADCIMGHHPHVLQGIEFYKNRPIIYSLGNFVFGAKGDRTTQSMIFNMEINKKGIVNAKIIPARINQGKPIIVEDEDRANIINLINQLSSDCDTKVLEDGSIVGNIEYVKHDGFKSEHGNQLEHNEINDDTIEDKAEDKIGEKLDSSNEKNNNNFSFINFLTEYGLTIFVITSALFVILMIIIVVKLKCS